MTASSIQERRASYGRVYQLRNYQSAKLRDLVKDLGALRERVCRASEDFTRSILILDDDEGVVDSLSCLLRRELPGVPVYGATSCEEGKRLWYRHRCCLVVADLVLGCDHDGVKFLESLGRSPEAILMSGVSDPETLRRAALIAGATPLSKPCHNLPDLALSLMDKRFGTLSLTTDGDKWVRVSEGLAKALGFSRDALEGMTWGELSPTGDPRPSGEQESFISRVKSADGGLLPLRWTCSPQCEGGIYYCSAQKVNDDGP